MVTVAAQHSPKLGDDRLSDDAQATRFPAARRLLHHVYNITERAVSHPSRNSREHRVRSQQGKNVIGQRLNAARTEFGPGRDLDHHNLDPENELLLATHFLKCPRVNSTRNEASSWSVLGHMFNTTVEILPNAAHLSAYIASPDRQTQEIVQTSPPRAGIELELSTVLAPAFRAKRRGEQGQDHHECMGRAKLSQLISKNLEKPLALREDKAAGTSPARVA